jgi:transposase
MERSTIQLLKKRGNTDAQIARVLGRDRRTVKRGLDEPVDKAFERPARGSLVDAYEDKIVAWIEAEIPVTVMFDRLRKDEENPYQGGRSILYERVKLIRQRLKTADQQAIWRFEGLAGEYLQVDWGEKRQFPFTQIPQETRYCFVCRLKYSRWIYAEFHNSMRYETLIRCILRSFESMGGVPWVLVFDNMSTVTSGRNDDGSPIWNPKFQQFAAEIGFHPELCARYAPNQKGTVENGVDFVKNNFLAGRTFTDDADLATQLKHWLSEKNHQRSQAHGQLPIELLAEEQEVLEPFSEQPDAYGLLHNLRVSPEAVIRFQTNRYSVPESLLGQIVTVRVAEKELRIYHDGNLVAQHERCFEKGQWIRDLTHYPKTLEQKPRAKVMAYREKLLGLAWPVSEYVAAICRRDRQKMNSQILSLYALWQAHGTDKFVGAVQFCLKEQVFGAEYVELMLRQQPDEDSQQRLCAEPIQEEIDRDLSIYDTYTHR